MFSLKLRVEAKEFVYDPNRNHLAIADVLKIWFRQENEQ
jgi:hypothetical protein